MTETVNGLRHDGRDCDRGLGVRFLPDRYDASQVSRKRRSEHRRLGAHYCELFEPTQSWTNLPHAESGTATVIQRQSLAGILFPVADQGLDQALFQENERTAPAADERKFVDVGPHHCRRGGRLDQVTIAYETWGRLNESRDNAILIQHALSGDSHAIGWWERMIGPGRGIDTDSYFVIGHNVLGGCQGTTGPASKAGDGMAYGSRFPRVTVEDMVDVQEKLLAHLGISRLMGTAGGSMGGMISVEWARRNQVRKAFVTASCAAHSAMQIGFNESARQAIKRDPKFKGGDYGDDPPRHGLSVARMIGHISYLSDHSFERKFGRGFQDGKEDLFQVESYLNYQGDKFTHRFDANSLIVLSRAIDDYECKSLAGSSTQFCVISYSSDWLYTPRQGAALHALAVEAGLNSEYHVLDLPFGHDSFLLDGELQAPYARGLFSSP